MLLALLPAVFLGSNSIITAKIDGKPSQGTLGTTIGALLFAIAVSLCYVVPHAGWAFAYNPRIWVVGLCSGVFWTIGSFGQYSALKPLGVSVAMPISTAGQVVGNALMAAIVLEQWTTLHVWAVGMLAIILVTAGAVMCSARDHTEGAVQRSPKDVRAGLTALLFSTLGFMMYFLFPNLLHKTGFIGDDIYNAPSGDGLYYMTSVILPQAVGQVLTALAIITFIGGFVPIVGAVVTTGWVRWVLVAGAILLPYVAVVMANAVATKSDGFDLTDGAGDRPQLTSGTGSEEIGRSDSI